MTWLALDIGGANLKLADGHGYADSRPFPLWQNQHQLVAALRSAIATGPACDQLAVTMTGELADCFTSKEQGVRFIVDAAQEAAGHRPVYIYLVDGRLVSTDTAAAAPLSAASANWHALARYCGQLVPQGSALLMDIGSTTVDFVPLQDGEVVNVGATDLTRLAAGELVYTGIERSPVCALVQSLPLDGVRHAVAQEVFATARDVHLLIGNLPEDPNDRCTADQQPATMAAAHRRLARMLCADAHEITAETTLQWAREIAAAQLRLLAKAARQVVAARGTTPATIIVTGHGQWLAQQLLEQLGWSSRIVSLDTQLGPHVSRCATAHALAVLAHSQLAHTKPAHSQLATQVSQTPSPEAMRVVKVGGSLLSLDALGDRLEAWLSEQPPAATLLLIGGGELADGVRGLDQRHGLPSRVAHEQAIRAMHINSVVLQQLLPEATWLNRLADWNPTLHHSPGYAILDPVPFMQLDEPVLDGPRLPIGWDVTSDSIAARLAHVVGATELVLLKSSLPRDAAPRISYSDAALTGYVDQHFAIAASGLPTVRAVSLGSTELGSAELGSTELDNAERGKAGFRDVRFVP